MGRAPDVTADCVAKAFGVPIDTDARALAILHQRLKVTGAEMTEARLRRRVFPRARTSSSTRCRGA
jgi:molybdopterin-biosynthesis enzyme MoeA-like protein